VCELLGEPYRTTRLPQPPGARRRWTDEAILDALRSLEAELGRPLTARYLCRLRTGRNGKPGSIPSCKTVYDRCGSWQRTRELMDGRAAADERRGESGG
jgi:hypothetical protein